MMTEDMQDMHWHILNASTGEVIAKPGDVVTPEMCERLSALLDTGDLDVISSEMAIDLDALVSPGQGCPECGERGQDELVWRNDDEFVECQTCGCRYLP